MNAVKTLMSSAYNLPKGQRLSDEVWKKRHGLIVKLIVAQILALFAFAIARGFAIDHVVVEMGGIALLAALASLDSLTKVVRESLATLALTACSAGLVHFSAGSIEAHFHFFFVVGIISLYQRWAPLLLAIGVTIAHHAIVGVLFPVAVYDHPAAWQKPWLWALIHGSAVFGVSMINIVAWRINIDDSARDRLTGLGNSRLLMDRLEHGLYRRRRMDGELGVAFVDLDGFKHVNDSLGHAAGDDLLTQVARRIESCLRASDTAARLGGDEFVLVIEDATVEGVSLVARRVLAEMSNPFWVFGQEIFVGASVGVAIADPDNSTPEALLKCADAAMYAAKRQGKSRIEFYKSSMGAAEAQTLKIQTQLQRALARREFTIVYQPLVDVASGRMIGAEALLRWSSREFGSMSPETFIPVAESSGMIHQIGAWVLDEACRQAAQWRAGHGDQIHITVNVSPRQLQRPEFPADVTRALDAAGLPAEGLVLEITESCLVDTSDAMINTLNELKRLGVRIAVDDFGTGFSSISYLRKFPVDILKIDRSFVNVVQRSPEEAAITKAIVKLGHTFGLTIVAKGVESKEQVEILRHLGCELAQGFYFSPPVADTGIDKLLAGTNQRAWSTERNHEPSAHGAEPSESGTGTQGAEERSHTAGAKTFTVTRDHFVQFYDADSVLVASVQDFIGAGLNTGDACLVVASAEHRRMFETALTELGFDLTAARETGQYIPLDARETLSTFMVDGRPDLDAFKARIGAIITAASEGTRGVRIFGEMVALLWDDGNAAAAMELEEHWNELAQELSFNLFCAYPIRAFTREESADPFQQVCKSHTRAEKTSSHEVAA